MTAIDEMSYSALVLIRGGLRTLAVVHDSIKVENVAHTVAAKLQAVGTEAQAVCTTRA